jgi:hypothetical protein
METATQMPMRQAAPRGEVVDYGDEGQDKRAQKRREEHLKSKMQAVAARLEKEALKRVGLRQPIEQRWIEDLEQFHGRYDQQTEKSLKDAKKSQLFINMTRPKTTAMAARLMDLLFPTDDKNWGIQPTPVPELSQRAKDAAKAAQKTDGALRDAVGQAQMQGMEDPSQDPNVMALATEDAKAQQAKNEVDLIMEEARKRSEAMEAEIHDQLVESHYHAVMRDVIEDASKLGSGVCKGPMTGDRIRKGWKEQGDGTYQLVMAEGDQPAMRYVDLWSYFPDMDQRNPSDGEGDMERHLMNRKQLRGLAKLPGFDKEAIRRLLTLNPTVAAPAYLTDLRNITGANTQSYGSVYHVWEFSGSLEPEEMLDLAIAMGTEEDAADVARQIEVDPLTDVKAVVWFCQGEVLKFSIYPYDSGESMYSVFCLEKDEASPFGYGIPYIMRHPQRSLNAGWRAMLDNSALAAAPQVVIARDMVSPANGSYELEARKIWYANAAMPKDSRAFDVFTVPSVQNEMAGVIALSKQFIDDMTAMPALAQGEQGSGVTKTAQGMALLMNSANVVFRRIVKNFDDDVTVPSIRRFYDWNMQFSKKEHIKGDYQVDARGSSVLLVREMQAQNLMVLAFQLGGHPVYGPMIKDRAILKKLFQANMIPSDEVLLSDEEIDAVLARTAAQAQAMQERAAPAGPDPQIAQMEHQFRMDELNAKVELANMEAASRKEVAIINRETQLMLTAEKMNLTADQLASKLQIEREKIGSSERKFAAELAQTQRTGPSGGGSF